MGRLPLTVSCLDYDRVRPLLTGEVDALGLDLNVLTNPPDESIWRMSEHGEFDAAEMTFAAYLRLAAEGADLLAIPVFLVRCFPHGGIFVNRRSGIREPKDLEGRRVGVGEYRMTMAVWARGILGEEYGVDLDAVTWCTARAERDLDPEGPEVSLLDAGPPLAERLVIGELDALIVPRVPAQLRRASDAVTRLFADPRAAEEAYFQRTGVFPILHLVVVRRSLCEEQPWVASSLYRAFAAAKDACMQGLSQSMEGQLVAAPWIDYHLDDVRRLMSADFWPYGIEPNRPSLETFGRFAHEQRVVSSPVDVDELFAPTARDRPVASTRTLLGG